MTTMTMGIQTPAEPTRPGILMGLRGERIPLQDVAVHATLRDVLCEVRSTQTYRNDEASPIEAVYTFPLPLEATLLDVHVTLGARALAGVVVGKPEAERRYERAIADGDGAVMLELAEPGLYTMNVGNLLPGEVARIEIRYALLHRWTGDRLRLHFPTTIAPRYGAMPLAPHQQPQHSLTVEHRFAFSLTVHGALASAQFSSPSHALTQGRSDEALVLSLASERAVMDRDVVILLRAPQAPRSALLTGADGDGIAAIASFQPFLGGLQQRLPLALAIVVDCSGSMAGDSIAQAQRALQDILTQLHPGDRLGIVAFGSRERTMHGSLVDCTPATLATARAFCAALQADMGGTEVGLALDRAHALLRGTSGGNVFLITDGQVGAWEAVVATARATGHRHFTVGVGSAVSESFVRDLATSTQGAAELVSPFEAMPERIVRHFERMRSARARRVEVRWPVGALEAAPADFGAVFDGDTVVASARFGTAAPSGAVVLAVETEDGRVHEQLLHLSDAPTAMPASNGSDPSAIPSTVARLAAALRLESLDGDAARDTAVRYRLASRYTNWLAIAERTSDQKTDGSPELRVVPQTLAAGWGGIGAAAAMADTFEAWQSMGTMACSPAHMPPMTSSERTSSQSRLGAAPGGPARRKEAADHADRGGLEIPTFLRRISDGLDVLRDMGKRGTGPGGHDASLSSKRLLALFIEEPKRLDHESAIELLRQVCSVAEVEALLLAAHRHGIAEESVAFVALSAIARRLPLRSVPPVARSQVRLLFALAEGVRTEVEDVPELAALVARL